MVQPSCAGAPWQPPGKQGQLGCWHVPVNPVQSIAVRTSNMLRKLVTSVHSAPLVSKPPSSTEVNHLFAKKSQRSAVPLSYATTCTIRLSLEKGKPCLQSLAPNWEAIKPGYCTSQEMHASPGLRIRTGQTDTHKSDPERCIPSLLHTERLEHLLDRPHRQCRWGMIPIPLKQGQGSQF